MPHTVLLCLSVLSSLLTVSLQCDLFWSTRQSLGYEQGTRLQVCCNVSRVRIWSFSSASSFVVGNLSFDQPFAPPTNDIWSELQLSECSDRPEPTIGWVGAKPGVTCQYHTGQTLDIPPGALTVPGWYIICYELADGCQTCSLEAICENDLSIGCSQIHVIGSSPRATNNSLDYWILAGEKFPFSSSSSVELEITNQRTRQPVALKTIKTAAGKKSNLTIGDLSPNEVYNVRRCLVVSLPLTLSSDQRFSFNSTKSRLCIEEGFRTERNTASTILQLSVILLLFWFLV